MYHYRPRPSWPERLFGSARTLAAIVLTAVLASALTVQWSGDASATGSTLLPPSFGTAPAAIPVTVEGTLVGAGDDRIAVLERGAESPVAFIMGDASHVVRGGENVPSDALRAGDVVRVTIDGASGLVLRLHAAPAMTPPFRVPAAAALLAALGLIAGAMALALLNRDCLPALPIRRATPRLLPVTIAR